MSGKREKAKRQSEGISIAARREESAFDRTSRKALINHVSQKLNQRIERRRQRRALSWLAVGVAIAIAVRLVLA